MGLNPTVCYKNLQQGQSAISLKILLPGLNGYPSAPVPIKELQTRKDNRTLSSKLHLNIDRMVQLARVKCVE